MAALAPGVASAKTALPVELMLLLAVGFATPIAAAITSIAIAVRRFPAGERAVPAILGAVASIGVPLALVKAVPGSLSAWLAAVALSLAPPAILFWQSKDRKRT